MRSLDVQYFRDRKRNRNTDREKLLYEDIKRNEENELLEFVRRRCMKLTLGRTTAQKREIKSVSTF